jgi:hypothetical protein
MVKVILMIFSIFLGYIQFRYVETPFRIGMFRNSFASWKVTLSATIILLAIPAVSAYTVNDVEDEYSYIRRVNQGLGKACEGSFDKSAKLNTICILGKEPKIVVWGDSYAMHLVPGLAMENKGLTQITKSVCGPIVGIAPIFGKYDSVWAKKCLEFNDIAFDYINTHQSITHVVLSANFSNYLKFNYLTHNGLTEGDYQFFVNAFKNTILELKKLGITPVVFSPLPQTGFDVGECLERMYGFALLLRENCNIDYHEFQQYQKLVITFLKDIEKTADVVWFEDYLCNNERCQVDIEDTFIYRDKGHLSIDGSVKLLQNLNLGEFK